MASFRAVLLSTVALAGLGGTALAADFVVDESPVIIDEVASDWGGLYVGVQAGVVSFSSVDDYDPSYTTPTDPYYNSGAFGGTLGVFAGFDAQVSDMFVLGVSGELNYDNVLVEQEGYEYARLEWDAAVKLRAGMLLNPSTLLYATVGYSVANVTAEDDYWGVVPEATGPVGGVLIGVGVDTMLTEQVFVRTEASAAFYGTSVFDYPATPPFPYWNITPTVLKATVGLGMKF